MSVEDSCPGVSGVEEWRKPLRRLRTGLGWRNVWGPARRPAWESLGAGLEDKDKGWQKVHGVRAAGRERRGEVI